MNVNTHVSTNMSQHIDIHGNILMFKYIYIFLFVLCERGSEGRTKSRVLPTLGVQTVLVHAVGVRTPGQRDVYFDI